MSDKELSEEELTKRYGRKIPLAIAVYLTDNNDLYSKELFTQEEIQAVQDNEDETTKDYKTIIVYPDMTTTDHT